MKKVILHGFLGDKFGTDWEFDIDSPSEIFSAIDANSENFLNEVIKKEQQGVVYNIFIDKSPLAKDQVSLNLGGVDEIHVVPALKGAGFLGDFWDTDMGRYGTYTTAGGLGMEWAGGLDFFQDISLDWIPFVDDFSLGDLMIGIGEFAQEIGIAMMLQGAIQALTDEPEHPEVADEQTSNPSSSSFIFSQPGNNVKQGVSVPVGYGRLRIGSSMISSSVSNYRLVKFPYMVIDSIESDPPTAAGGKVKLKTEAVQHHNI